MCSLMMQGPFPAKDMTGWHEAGYLHDQTLPMCGTVSCSKPAGPASHNAQPAPAPQPLRQPRTPFCIATARLIALSERKMSPPNPPTSCGTQCKPLFQISISSTSLQERKVSPPNLPTPEYFAPLGALLAFVRAGNKFNPVSVDDIRSGVPHFLA